MSAALSGFRTLLAAVLVAVGTVGAIVVSSQGPADFSVCLEDQSCWDCSAMGNRICGEVSR